MSASVRTSVRTAATDLIVAAEAVRIGSDIPVWICGGERLYLGAIGAAQPRPSREDPERISATSSVLAFLGYKQDTVVKTVAERLASVLATNVVVTAGIHWDHLSSSRISAVTMHGGEIAGMLADQLRKTGVTSS